MGTLLYTADGQPLALNDLLTGEQPVVMPVLVGAGRPALAASLLAAPLPPAAYAKRLARLTEQARLDQRPIPQRQLDLARWTLYLTNVPDLTFDQAHVLGRTRWQIELLFKHWKSHAHLLHSRSADPYRQLCEGYGKLIGILLAHWTLLVSGWEQDCLSALDTLHILRLHLPALQHALAFLPHYWISSSTYATLSAVHLVLASVANTLEPSNFGMPCRIPCLNLLPMGQRLHCPYSRSLSAVQIILLRLPCSPCGQSFLRYSWAIARK
ncbi:MAG: transposase [Chloroflexota bacterium]